MKICAFSDMHGQLDFNIEPCDIVLICGDIVPLYIQRNMEDSETWLKEVFLPWCENLPCEKVAFIGGNHDFFLYDNKEKIHELVNETKSDKIIYLDCEHFEYGGKIIFGSPWCKPFGKWAFMESFEESETRYKDIDHVDILMTHDAPYGVSDVLLQEDCWWADGSHIGNPSLRNLLDKTKPKLHVFGHLHSCLHDEAKHNNTSVFCVSLLNEDYKMVYEPLYFEL